LQETEEMRIAVGGILTECNHLGGIPIDMEAYESTELVRGADMLLATTSVVGGMLQVLCEAGAEPLPLLFASACAGGPIVDDCYRELRDELLERFDAILPVDGVLLPLHGAALAEGNDDPEGEIIREVRQRVGPDIPIVVTVDLHANITAEMVAEADAILAWETYPHYDQFQTGQRGARLLLDTLAGQCRPTMAMAKVPVITSAVHGSTNDQDPFAELMRYAKSLEERSEVLSTSLLLVHPYMDVAEMGSGGLVITDDDQQLAAELATGIARRYWQRRHDLEPETMVPAVAIRQGLEIEGGPVILVETSDCCGGGAAGDSVATLRALVEADVSDLCYVPVVDPEAAAACHAAGQAAELTLELGHKRDPRWGEPITCTGVVSTLSDGQFIYTGGQWEGHLTHMGPSAVLSVGSIRVLITTRATYDWADEQFRLVELDPARAKFIVAKNPMNYRWAYGKIAAATLVLDTPGPTPATLKHVEFQKLKRPYFPADLEIDGLEPTVLV
jgi:microcystin degradation protein MlrC